MATMESTPKTRTPRRRAIKASECIADYGASAGVLSFRHGLRVCERNAIDKALAIVGRCFTQNQTVFATPEAVKLYLQLQISGEQTERFAVLFLDVQNRFIAFETMFIGTLTQTSVYPREVVMAALGHRAAAVVLAHNHPSGTVQPSHADEDLTQTLKATLDLIGVRVLDHVIVAPGAALSMAERGLL